MSNIDKIAKQDFMNYALEVIQNRAIPNIQDNLKAVHRRILYSMYLEKLWSNKKHKKSAAVVGHTMGHLHPHGDSSIYDSLIRLAQPWKMRYPLIDVQGNKGNISGDPAAAMRYTECRLSPIGELMVRDLEFDSVPLMPTYDESSTEPMIMPSMFPNILCNGNKGIAVGMSSDVLPHNLKEAVAAIKLTIENPGVTVDDILAVMPGPDLPTGAVITNIDKAKEVYASGRGTFEVKAKYHVETKGAKTHIVFTEIPYLVDIQDRIVKKIKDLAIEGELNDVYDIQNNTGRNGIEIRVILKPKASVHRVLKVLFENTGLRNSARMGLTILDNGKPIQTNIIGLIKNYLEHRHNVLSRIAAEKKEKAEARLHIVEGLLIAVQDIDGVIEIVKASSSRPAAQKALKEKYKLTDVQAKAILDMRISQINKMDTTKLANEEKSLHNNIAKFNDIMVNVDTRNAMIKNSLDDLARKFGDERRTVLANIEEEVIVDNRDLVVALHENNEVSIVKKSDFSIGARARNGKKLFSKVPHQAVMHNTKGRLIVFDDEGRSYRIPNENLEVGQSQYLNDIDERIKGNVTYITSFNEEDMQKEYLIIVTRNGIIKKTKLEEYRMFKGYTYAIRLKGDDAVMYAMTANDDEFVFIHSDKKMNKFQVGKVNASGRHTIGSKGMEADSFLGAVIMSEEDKLIMFGKNGKGKFTKGKDFSTSVKAGRGQLTHDEVRGLVKQNGDLVRVIGKDGKVLAIKEGEIPSRQPKSLGVKILGSEIATIVL